MSSVRMQLQAKFASKGGKDQGVTTNHPQGLGRKYGSSCEKTPYLCCEDDDAKKPHMKGQNCKTRGPEEDGPEPAQKMPRLTGLVGSVWPLFVAVHPPPSAH
jgi:hypothetical protein